MKLRRRVALLVGPLALVAAATMSPVLATSASASPAITAYGPTSCTITISITPNPVGLGATITITISGTCGNDTIIIVIHSTAMTLGSITTDASGNGSGTFTIPTSLPPGTHTITASDSSGNSASVNIVLTGVSTGTTATTTAAPLAFTGTDAAALGAVGAGALGVGGLLVLGSRKRRSNKFT